MRNIIEEYRKEAMEHVKSVDSFMKCFPKCLPAIRSKIGKADADSILALGDSMREIFRSTKEEARVGDAKEVNGNLCRAGTFWECMETWYCNLTTLGRRTVVIKKKQNLIPTPIWDALVWRIGEKNQNTETDLIAITFPDLPEYSADPRTLRLIDENGKEIRTYRKKRDGSMEFNRKKVFDFLARRDFNLIEVHVIQCKTNWNDSSYQVSLWNDVYEGRKSGITTGQNGYSIKDLKRFSYSFATVPTNRVENYNSETPCVHFMKELSGGNYWGMRTKDGVAESFEVMIEKNLSSGSSKSLQETLSEAIPDLSKEYSYFGL